MDAGVAVEAGTAAGSNATGNVLANDTDVDAGDTKAVSAITGGTLGVARAGTYGSVTLNADGTYTYVVNNANGAVNALRTAANTLTDTFTYTMVDAAGASSAANLVITIQGSNDGPVAVVDAGVAVEAGTAAGSNATGNVLANDTDVDAGDTKAVSAITGGTLGVARAGTYGSVTLNADGTYTYVVNNANGAVNALRTAANTLTDTFTYTMVDAAGASSAANLVITIQGSNDGPVAVVDAGVAVEAGTAAGSNATGNVLTNDTDVDAGDTKAVSAVAGVAGNVGNALVGAYGTLTLNADGSYAYVVNNANPTVNALRTSADTVTETFAYTMTDTAGASSTASLVVTIHGSNDAPVATADVGTAVEAGTAAGSNAVGNVLANDTDVDAGDSKTVSAVAGVAANVGAALVGTYGTLTLNADGSYSYVVNDANATVNALRLATDTLTDTFAYTMKDTAGATSTANLVVTIQGSNDAPVAVADNIYINGPDAVGVTIQNSWLVANDTDVDDISLNVGSAASGTNVTAGAVTGTTTTITSNVAAGASGNFTYVATDGAASSTAATVTVTRGAVASQITGGAGNDILIETAGIATTLDGGAGNDYIIGGTAADVIVGQQNDVLLDGGANTDTLNIGANFTATSDAQIVNIENVLLTAAAAVNLANQTEAFTITGSAGVDSITAGSGNDTIVGDQSDTLLDGSAGTDTLNIGANFTATSDAQIANIENVLLTAAATVNLANQTEAFTITGSAGVDSITAGSGNDTIVGDQSDTLLDGSAGTDTLNIGANFTATSDAQIANIENVLLTVAATVNLANQTEAFTITGSAGADTITGGTAADSISAGAGADIINLANGDFAAGESIDGGTEADSIVLTNATTVDFTTGSVSNVETLTGSGRVDKVTMSATQLVGFTTIDLAVGNDILNVVASGDISASAMPTLTSIRTGNLTGTTGTDSITLTGTQLNSILTGTGTVNLGAGTGDTINLTSTSTELNTLGATDASIQGVEAISAATAAAGVTVTLKDQTEAFTVTGSGFDDAITGGTAADTISGGAGADTITAGEGADTVTGGAGADTFVVNRGETTVTIGGTGDAGTISGYDVITDFDTAVDKLNLNGAPFAAANRAGVNGADSTLTIAGATVKSHSITNGMITFDDNNTFTTALTLTSTAEVAAVMQYLRLRDLGNAGATVAFTATIGGTAHTYIYEQVANAVNNRNDILVDLVGVTVTNLSTLIGNSVIDPIVLDLGAAGLAFTSLGGGVQFDINADGIIDQVAWTTGEDGILAFDVDGSGTIDSGSEIFTPWFAGGLYSSGVAALASLDSNADGVISAADTHFYDLRVWIDADVDGVSDEGELSSLIEQGIESISLNTTLSSAEIDGQSVLSEGGFTNADGSTGAFVEVTFDAALGSDAGDVVDKSGNNMVTGSDGSDIFAWVLADRGSVGVPAVDTVVGFGMDIPANGGDVLDLRDLLVGESAGGNLGNLAAFLHFEKSGADTIIHISTTGGFASDEHRVGAPSEAFTSAADQQIVLAGVDMIGAFTTDQQVIQDLLTRGKLHTD